MKRRHLFLLKMCPKTPVPFKLGKRRCYLSPSSFGLLWNFLTGLFVDSLAEEWVQRAANGSLVGRWLLVFMRGSSSISWSLRAIQFCRPICTFFPNVYHVSPSKQLDIISYFHKGSQSWSRKHFHLFSSREEFTLRFAICWKNHR